MRGFLLEVRAWEPPREQRVDSPTQQLSHAIGALLARHAAVLVAGEPLVDAEIEQSRWLSSPIFASGLTAVHLPTAHPLRYLTAHQIDTNSSSAASSLAVSNPTAIDGVLPSEQAFLLELTKGMDLGINTYGCERLHEKICSVLELEGADKRAGAAGAMFVQLRKMLVGWLLVHTGTLPVAMRYANTLNSKATANKSDGESLATIWKSADMLAKAMRESEGNFMSSWARLLLSLH